jgi:hypothetical protein
VSSNSFLFPFLEGSTNIAAPCRIISNGHIFLFAGQEIDFLTLLQSFGLNMGSVADALGVDVATLNNMDRDVLFQMLTSQQSVTSGNNN